MPFDFNALLQDPSFQFGAQILGSPGPDSVSNAFASLQKMQQIKQEQAYQNAQIEQTKEARRIQQEQYERQLVADTAKEKRQAEKDASDAVFFDRIEKSGIFGPSGKPSVEAPAPPPAPVQSNPAVQQFAAQYGPAAQLAGQKIGVDPQLLLGQWGHETGWGKSVIPGTNNLGNIKGPNGVTATDNATGSSDSYAKYASPEDFATNYADLIQRKYPAALNAGADSGKFFSALKQGGYAEDPNYVLKGQVAAAMAQKQAALQPPAPPPQQQPLQAQGPNGLDVARIGALASLKGLKGGPQLLELGKMLQPQNVPAGSYQQNPQTGQLTYVPNPQDTIKNSQEAQKIALEEKRTNAAVSKETQAISEKKATSIGAYHEVASSMDSLSQAADELLKMPGLPLTTGLSGAAKAYNLTEKGRDAAAALDTLQSRLTIDTLQKMKAVSANGSSGFGALNKEELHTLETYVVNLSKATSLSARLKALREVKEFADKAKSNAADRIKNTYGEDSIKLPSSPQQTPLPDGWSFKEK